MADKTASTQPSTSFHGGLTPITHSLTGGTSTSTSTSPSLAPSSSSSTINTVLLGLNRTQSMEPHTQFHVQSTLMSPPEARPLETFNRKSPEPTMPSRPKQFYAVPASRFPISPPVSPATKNITAEESPPLVTRDPILYPNTEAGSAPASQTPLFGDEALAAQRVVHGHVAARGANLFRAASPPRQSEYELALDFQSKIFRDYARSNQRERRAWFARERAQLLEDQAMRSGVRRYPVLAPATVGRPPRASTGGKNPGKVVKPHRPAKPAAAVRTGAGATPEPGKRVAREDKDFEALVDYSPPTSSLPSKPNSLKVDWRGAPIDLRGDPNAKYLHPDELSLAANLRLDCATYLTSKRRIFLARIDALRIKKEFRKTDAQQACKIDVNKASKLWQAYEKVGWLHPRWVERYV